MKQIDSTSAFGRLDVFTFVSSLDPVLTVIDLLDSFFEISKISS